MEAVGKTFNKLDLSKTVQKAEEETKKALTKLKSPRRQIMAI